MFLGEVAHFLPALLFYPELTFIRWIRSVFVKKQIILLKTKLSLVKILQSTRFTLIFFDLSILQYKEKTVNTISNKTYNATPSTIEKKWVLVDAADQTLGRLSSRVASILRGKNKPEFTPHMDTGDNVVVINAEKAILTGKKMTDKLYFRHTGYPGGEKFTSAEDMLKKDPTSLVRAAIKGMLPKNKLGRKLLTNLRIYAGPVHPHIAQQPEIKEI